MIGLVARARAGKDTLAEFLVEDHGFTRFAFADPLKDAFAAYHGIPRCWCDGVDEEGRPLDRETMMVSYRYADCGGTSGMSIRQGLQRFGTELGRNTFGEDFWVLRLADRIEQHIEETGNTRIVITDCRFENEVLLVQSAGGIVVGIVRDEVAEVAAHSSEALAGRLDEVADYVAENNGTLDDLRREAAKLVARLTLDGRH